MNPVAASASQINQSDQQPTTPLIDRELYDHVMTPNYAPMQMMPERGEGVRLWDTNGNEYLDFAAGIAVSALGHAHPVLQQALAEQAEKFWHVSNLLANKPAIDLAQKLCKLTFAERVFFANSGAEVNEAALKLARRFAQDQYGPEKAGIIAFDNAFHGRTFFTVCVGGQPKYSDGFGPKPGAISHVPFNDVDALIAAVDHNTCAIILEPVQGEGGVNPATPALLQAARSLCDQYNALLIFDEVQTGAGRSGRLFSYQKFGVTPDILTSAKGLGGGFPIGAMLTTEAIGRSFAVGTHGSTFGGNPLGCAVAGRLLDIISQPELLESVTDLGTQLFAALNTLNDELNVFSDIRGIGLLVGCELKGDLKNRAADLVAECNRQGLLVLQAGPNVLRLAPPLIVAESDIEKAISLLSAAIRALKS